MKDGTRYNAGPPIKIFQDDFDSGKYKTLPAICSTCLDLKSVTRLIRLTFTDASLSRRKSFSTTDLNVKILNDTEFDADGNRKAQPTVEPASSPEVEIIPASRKRKAPSLAVVAPPTPAGSRSSNRIRNAPQIRAAKAMHIIQMDKEDSVKDLKIKVRLSFPTFAYSVVTAMINRFTNVSTFRQSTNDSSSTLANSNRPKRSPN